MSIPRLQNLQIIQEIGNALRIQAEKISLEKRDEPGSYLHHSRPLRSRNESAITGLDRLSLPDNHIECDDLSTGRTVSTTAARSPARIRRRARDVVKSYRPNYTWNRGGRLKELRIRNLARKYAYIWKRKVFGRILPSVARAHYARKVYREVFDVLYEDWWVKRKEWRLNVRAECHDRFRLWAKYFKVWQKYTTGKKEKRVQEVMANTKYRRMLLGQVLYSWQLYVYTRREIKALNMQAVQHHQRKVLSKSLDAWKESLAQRGILASVERGAHRIYQINLVEKAWHRWRYRFIQSQSEKCQVDQADELRVFRLKRLAWNQWIRFMKSQAIKRRMLGAAIQQYKTKLLSQHVHTWRSRLTQLMNIRHHRELLGEVKYRIVQRRAFEHWKHYVVLNRQEREDLVSAESYAERQLMHKCFSALQLAVAWRREKLLREEKARRFYTKTILRETLDRWLARCDQCEELKMYHLTRRANQHYRVNNALVFYFVNPYRAYLIHCVWENNGSVIVSKCLDNWAVYSKYRRDKKHKALVADVHRMSVVMTNCLTAWKDYTDLQHWQQDAASRAHQLFRGNMEAKYFYTWQHNYNLSLDIRTMERMAILHDQEVLSRRALNVWRQRTAESLETEEKWAEAVVHHKHSTKRSKFKIWKHFIRRIQHELSDEKKAKKFHERRICRKVILKWRQKLKAKKVSNTGWTRAVRHHSMKTLQPVFQQWLSHTRFMCERRLIAEDRLSYHNQQLLGDIFIAWNEVSRQLCRQNEMVKQFNIEKNRGLALKVLDAWRDVAHRKSQARQADLVLIDKFREKHNQAMLKRSLNTWRSNRDHLLMEQLKYSQATIHCNRKLVSHYFQHLILAVQHSRQVKKLKAQAAIACDHRIQCKYFRLWGLRKQEMHCVEQKNELALWHWSLTLQRKCMIALYTYARKGRAKAKLYAECHSEFRRTLLVEGVRKWVKAADHLSQIRLKSAADRHTQDAHRQLALARKYSDIWRQRVKSGKPTSLPSNSLSGVDYTSLSKKMSSCATTIVGLKSSVRDEIVHQQPLSPLRSQTRTKSPQKYRSPPKPCISDLVVENLLIPKSSNSTRPRTRAAPKQPSFLMQSLEREGLWKDYSSSTSTNTGTDRTVPDVGDRSKGSSPGLAVPNQLVCSRPTPPLGISNQEPSSGSVTESSQEEAIDLQRIPSVPSTSPKRSQRADVKLLPPSAFTSQSQTSNNVLTEESRRQLGISNQPLREIHNLHRTNNAATRFDSQDVNAELESIQQTLLSYKTDRQKLRALKQQLSLLMSYACCVSETTPDQSLLVASRDEIEQLESEILSKTDNLRIRKQECLQLSHRLNELSHLC